MNHVHKESGMVLAGVVGMLVHHCSNVTNQRKEPLDSR